MPRKCDGTCLGRRGAHNSREVRETRAHPAEGGGGRRASWSSVGVWGNRRRSDLLTRGHSLTHYTLALFLSCAFTQRGGETGKGRMRKRSAVLRASSQQMRVCWWSTAPVIRSYGSHRSRCMETRSRQRQKTIATNKKVSVHGNPDYSSLLLCVSVSGYAVLAGV